MLDAQSSDGATLSLYTLILWLDNLHTTVQCSSNSTAFSYSEETNKVETVDFTVIFSPSKVNRVL